MQSYNNYKKSIIDQLIITSGKSWSNGIWAPTGKPVEHILPLDGKNTRENRANAIRKYLNFDCRICLPNDLNGLHQYAHHLNSSQLLCMMFFSKMLDKELRANESMVEFIKEAFNINIQSKAQCSFEYAENDKVKFPEYIFKVPNSEGNGDVLEYEGTSFDFHLNDIANQIYFEIKFTEQGFGSVSKPDERHTAKAQQYINLLPQQYQGISIDEMLKHYQIFRNIIRTKNENAHVIFITDKNNPATLNEIELFIKKYSELPSNIIFTTWQDISQHYTGILPFQLRAM